ncbi:hypothetical protein IRJ41_022567, partial [Triplophysa rosa]
AYLHTPRRLPVHSFYGYRHLESRVIAVYIFTFEPVLVLESVRPFSFSNALADESNKALVMHIYAVRLYLWCLDQSSNRPIVRTPKQQPVSPLTMCAVTTPDSGYTRSQFAAMYLNREEGYTKGRAHLSGRPGLKRCVSVQGCGDNSPFWSPSGYTCKQYSGGSGERDDEINAEDERTEEK